MDASIIILTVLALAAFSYFFGRRRVLAAAGGNIRAIHSMPGSYGWYAATLTILPGALVFVLWLMFGGWVVDSMVLADLPQASKPGTDIERRLLLNDIHNYASGDVMRADTDETVKAAATHYNSLTRQVSLGAFVLAALFAALGGLRGYQVARPDFRARNKLERLVLFILIGCSAIAIVTTLGIVLSLLFESLRFFSKVSIFEFLFGIHWSPQTALRADQVGSSGAFGAVPLFTGTLLISFVAMLVAVPLGLMAAIYMTQYADDRLRKIAKPLLEILAGVPTVVYGFFAALTVGPFIREFGATVGLSVASESALAAGLVMGIMIIPLMSSLSDDAITAVPQAMKDGSLALGATESETIRRVLIPAALPGIVGAFLLSVSRAIGETMIVVMAAGLAANLTANPLEAVTTVTAQIVALLKGDQEFDSAKTLSAFALGLVLFVATLLLNVLALRTVRKYREAYE
ncbi:MAG: phosphate ABC transporter permease subunit PstC [Sphingomonadales bacterium]|nr:phosphate ABC transporter permease subunit PstC [Sphingomonadales bacterium]